MGAAAASGLLDALHRAEVEARRKRGEGMWVIAYNLPYRVELLKTMVEKLKPGEGRAKAASAERLAQLRAAQAAKAALAKRPVTGS